MTELETQNADLFLRDFDGENERFIYFWVGQCSGPEIICLVDTEDQPAETHLCRTPAEALALAVQFKTSPLADVWFCTPTWMDVVHASGVAAPDWCTPTFNREATRLPIVQATEGQFAADGWPKAGWYFLTGDANDPVVHGPHGQWYEALLHGNHWLARGEALGV